MRPNDATAPLVPRFPLRMRNTEILTVVYRTDPSAARRLVPEELDVPGDAVLVHIYRMHDADWFGSYGESAVQIPALHAATETAGAFSPFLYVETDGAVAAGREIYGQPKKLARVELGSDGDLLVGRVTRNGIDLITATMPYKQRESTPEALEALGFRTNLNLKVIPAVDGRGEAVLQLTAREFADVELHEVWEGPGTLELRPNAQAPVHLLPVLAVVRAYHWRADFTLVYGRVLENGT